MKNLDTVLDALHAAETEALARLASLQREPAPSEIQLDAIRSMIVAVDALAFAWKAAAAAEQICTRALLASSLGDRSGLRFDDSKGA